VIAATNQELPRLVSEGRFREDLFYRINVIGVHLPPLRERPEDIPLLADHFLAKFTRQMEKPIRAISREAQERLVAHGWPGNVRELENAIERAVAVEQTPTLLPESLPPQVRPDGETRLDTPPELPGGLPAFPELQEGFDLEARGEDFYRHYIALALERSGGVQTKAADLLGMSFRSFRYYAKKLNLR
jgi:two-component system response regulator PilR (NtrC family)